jgi:hypothetical protein
MLENKPIHDRAVEYQRIGEFMRMHTSPEKPWYIEDVYAKLKDEVKGKQQVYDAIRSFGAKGWVGKIADGQRKLFWWKPGAIMTTVVGKRGPNKNKKHSDVTITRPFATTPQPAPREATVALVGRAIEGRPEIIVNDNSITINHAKCKITVEFNNA